MGSQTFNFTGAEVSFTVPAHAAGSFKAEVVGAQGGPGSDGVNSYAARGGARLQLTLGVVAGDTLLLGVAGAGLAGDNTGSTPGGFYAGGAAPAGIGQGGSSGAGQSYIKRGGSADSNRIAVAGGAGGCGIGNGTAGNEGGVALDTEATTASTATAASAGNAGGGGGGWRGGAGGATVNVQGAGGTSMAHSTQTSAVTSTPGFQAGDGYIILSWTDPVGAGTTAQRFFEGVTNPDQTISGAATVKNVPTTAPAANSTGTMTWTATGLQSRTAIPLAGSTVNSDTTQNNGWVADEGLIQSTTGGKRVSVPGVWNFSALVNLNAPALLATVSATCTWRVYRVATGGGARTLLFSVTSAAVTNAGVAAVDVTATGASASQPEYQLEPGEVFMLGEVWSSQATVNALNQVTNTVITKRLGTSSYVDLPTPGLRTKFFYVAQVLAQGVAARQAHRILKAFLVTALGIAAVQKWVSRAPALALAVGLAKVSKFVRPESRAVVAIGVVSVLKYVRRAPVAVSVVGVASILKYVRRAPATVIAVGAARFSRLMTAARAFAVTTVGVAAFARAFVGVRRFDVVAVGAVMLFVKISQAILNRLADGGQTIVRKVLNIFDDS